MRNALRLVVVTCLLGTACNRGPSREEFVSQANDVCRDAERALASATPAAATAPPEEVIAHFADVVDHAATIASDLLEDLRRLDPPAADRVAIGLMLDDLARYVRTLERYAAALGEGAGARAERINKNLEKVKFFGLARDYGLDACASVLSSEGG